MLVLRRSMENRACFCDQVIVVKEAEASLFFDLGKHLLQRQSCSGFEGHRLAAANHWQKACRTVVSEEQEVTS